MSSGKALFQQLSCRDSCSAVSDHATSMVQKQCIISTMPVSHARLSTAVLLQETRRENLTAPTNQSPTGAQRLCAWFRGRRSEPQSCSSVATLAAPMKPLPSPPPLLPPAGGLRPQLGRGDADPELWEAVSWRSIASWTEPVLPLPPFTAAGRRDFTGACKGICNRNVSRMGRMIHGLEIRSSAWGMISQAASLVSRGPWQGAAAVADARGAPDRVTVRQPHTTVRGDVRMQRRLPC